ncbi:MAG: BamA/TamA family outer membrane protein [Candidatus Eisenbacteria bacterium]
MKRDCPPVAAGDTSQGRPGPSPARRRPCGGLLPAWLLAALLLAPTPLRSALAGPPAAEEPDSTARFQAGRGELLSQALPAENPPAPPLAPAAAPPTPWGARGLAEPPRERGEGLLFVPRLALLPVRAALHAGTLPVRLAGALLSPTGLLQRWARGVRGEGSYIIPLVGVDPSWGANIAVRAGHESPLHAGDCIAYRLAFGGTREQIYSVTLRSRDPFLLPYTEGWSYRLTARYAILPDRHYFGRGNFSDRDNLAFYTLEQYLFLGSLRYAPTSRMRWDLTFSSHRNQIRNGSALDEDDRGIEQLFGHESVAPGLTFDPQNVQAEIALVLDGRDSRGRPADGVSAEGYLAYAWGTGSDIVDFVRYGGELQLCRSFGPRHVLVMRLAGEEARTDTRDPRTGGYLPIKFTEIPSLGGPGSLRGYLRDRYMDNAAVLTNIEYRYRVSPVVEATLFADFGKVMPRLLEFTAIDVHRSWGAGVRLATDEWMYLRLQAAASDEDVVFSATLEPVFDRWDRRERR